MTAGWKLVQNTLKKPGKWVLGKSWVTLRQNGDVYYCIEGAPQGRYSGTADEAKIYVEAKMKEAGK